MALSTGKITVIVGAGLVCSVIAKQVFSSDLFSGSFKEVVNQLNRNAPIHSSSSSNEVNNIPSQELHIPKPALVSNDGRSEFGTYVLVVVVLGIGSGCVWWKRWRFSEVVLSRKRARNGVLFSIPKLRKNICFIRCTQQESELQRQENLKSNVQHIDSALPHWEAGIRRTTETPSFPLYLHMSQEAGIRRTTEKRGWRFTMSTIRRALNYAFSSVAQLVGSAFSSNLVSEQRGDVSSSADIQQVIQKLESPDSELQYYKNAMDSYAKNIVSEVHLTSQEAGISCVIEGRQARSSQSDEMPVITYTSRNKKGAGTVASS